MSDGEGEQFFDLEGKDILRLESRLKTPRNDGQIDKDPRQQKGGRVPREEPKKPTRRPDKNKGLSQLEQLILKYVEEESCQDALKDFGGLIANIRQAHQAEMTSHLEKVATEHRANLQALTKSQQEHEKVSKEILSAVIAIRSNLNENHNPRPKPLDPDQVKAARALGFGIGYRTALNVFDRIKGVTPDTAGSQEVKNMAIRAAEDDEYEGSPTFFRRVIDTVKKRMKQGQ
uniref:Phosphoprotein n=1 Tax=Infectious hematopoietic necrosis virus TaxID=11290 RepID=N0BRA4_9RHAB|nr:phosphoprotein [Infectious hematopoietic necrosis virus]AII03084.1 phosphoprotein [Infectious hematopoietic necrosis virus]QAA77546.1 phosphoprotein [Infectious hematopoietic necrosis virus]UKS51575.1 phosphoprotein [Infectious hematopoietic necrosis virus]